MGGDADRDRDLDRDRGCLQGGRGISGGCSGGAGFNTTHGIGGGCGSGAGPGFNTTGSRCSGGAGLNTTGSGCCSLGFAKTPELGLHF